MIESHRSLEKVMQDQETSWQSLVLVAIIGILAVISFNSFIIINPGEAGVLSILGKAKDGVLLEGVHFKPPVISQVDVYDLTVQKFEVPAQSSTKDLQQLTASFAINFRLDPIEVVTIRRTQGTLQNIVSKIIAPQTQESFKVAAARRTVEEAITKRDEQKQAIEKWDGKFPQVLGGNGAVPFLNLDITKSQK